MQTYRLTKAQLEAALRGAIGLYLEFRDIHDHEDDMAQDSGVNEVLEGLDADQELAANDPTERLRLQLPDTHEELVSALELALRYLDHPEVVTIPFAMPVTSAIDRARAALSKSRAT